MAAVLELTGVGHAWDGGAPLFTGVDLEVGAGELLVVAGASGSGKSTVLEICAGLVQPTSGTVAWEGEVLGRMSRERLFEARRRVGYVFQVPALIANMTVFDNIALPLRYHTDTDETAIRLNVEARLREFGLLDVVDAYPESLAVRQAKCAAIVRAFILDPELVFLDDPTAGLDDGAEAQMIEALRRIRASRRVTMVMVTGTSRVMQALGGRVALLRAGRIAIREGGSPAAWDIEPRAAGVYEQSRTG